MLPELCFFSFFQTLKFYFFFIFFPPRARRGTAAGTEVALMMMANGMVFVARIMTVECTALVSTIITDGAAIGSCITRTGQSTVNGTPK